MPLLPVRGRRILVRKPHFELASLFHVCAFGIAAHVSVVRCAVRWYGLLHLRVSVVLLSVRIRCGLVGQVAGGMGVAGQGRVGWVRAGWVVRSGGVWGVVRWVRWGGWTWGRVRVSRGP